MQNNYEIIALGDVRVRSVDAEHLQPISDGIRERIEAIWQEGKKQKNNGLFNGTLPHFISLESDGPGKHIIKVQFVEYKLFYAQQKLSDLDLGIRPLGVSGIIVLKDAAGEHFVFAQRSQSVTEYPSYWELVPSGSLDRDSVQAGGEVDFSAKIMSEFEEETGLSKDLVKKISAYAVILDKTHQVYDICCKIEIESKANALFRDLGASQEFSSFQVVSLREVQNFFRAHREHVVPTSVALIEAYKGAL